MKKRRAGRARFDTAANVLLAIAAVVAVVVLLQSRVRESGPVSNAERNIERWEQFTQDATKSIGDQRASVTVIVWSDFQCPFCAELAARFSAMDDAFRRGELRMVFKHLPNTRSHPWARKAALASECAAAAGRFEPVHDALFRGSASLSDSVIDVILAEDAALDSAAIEVCSAATRFSEQISADSLEGVGIGATGTPTMVVNGRVLRGLPDSVTFETMLRELIARDGRWEAAGR